MKKILLLFAAVLFTASLFAQDNPSSEEKNKKQAIDLSGRANDHFLIQLGPTFWNGRPDSVHTKGLSKSVNVYLLYDFPFKTDPHMSVAIGLGVGSDQMYFDKMYIGIKDNTATINFKDQSDTNHFKKTKLATAWVEAPVELRYTFDPAHYNKSLKAALGIKIGALLNAHTRSKNLVSVNNAVLNSYVEKEASKKFFNGNRVVGTARIGYGHVSLFGTYQISTLFKQGEGPDVRPFSVGITLSGL